jgi:hypothetical protein
MKLDFNFYYRQERRGCQESHRVNSNAVEDGATRPANYRSKRAERLNGNLRAAFFIAKKLEEKFIVRR